MLKIVPTYTNPGSGDAWHDARCFHRVVMDNGQTLLKIQGSMWGSCAIGGLYSFHYAVYQSADLVEPLLKLLTDFVDKPRWDTYNPKRFVIQLSADQIRGDFMGKLLPHCELLTTFTNHSHKSDDNMMYMLDLGKK